LIKLFFLKEKFGYTDEHVPIISFDQTFLS
jgi:hypothetical protein